MAITTSGSTGRDRLAACVVITSLALFLGTISRRAGIAKEPVSEKTVEQPTLGDLSTTVFPAERREAARESLSRDLRARIQLANDESRAAWQRISTRSEWDAFRAARIKALRQALGRWPEAPASMRQRVTGTIVADGFAIDKVVYESRPGWWVTANLYRPLKTPNAAAGIILSHSHHSPKHQGELQEMGATWARAGCYVLVPDHMGHGERGQHGFKSAADYPKEFRPSRQDYYFRYDSSIQLYLVGDTLMGWMAWDLMRGVDLLLAQPGIDKRKIALLGSVAGGGDPCAVATALDERIACAVPFNFGGPQPETRYPLPVDAETWFNYAGGGSWESTRNLAYSARSGESFLPWEIVAAIAPRRLVYGHEFSWDRERDPVWRRLERIYDLYGARDQLAFTHGRGNLKGQPPEASHCDNIGAIHRAKIHEAFDRWFGIKAVECRQPRVAAELIAVTPDAARDLRPRMLHEVLGDQADASLSAARRRNEASPNDFRHRLRADLSAALGNVAAAPAKVAAAESVTLELNDDKGEGLKVAVDRVRLATERELELPLVVLRSATAAKSKCPAVIGISSSGKVGFLKHADADVAKILRAGMIVCLPDLRGTGEASGDGSHDQFSESTALAATALMVGDPIVAQQLRDARTVLAYLRSRDDVDAKRVAVWGASFASPNATDVNIRVPRRIDGRPNDVDPLGGLLALLVALYDDDVAAVCVDRGLTEFRGALESPFVYVPLDCVVPGLLQRADLADLTAAVAPRPVMLRGMVDATNRSVKPVDVASRYRAAVEAYRNQQAPEALTITAAESNPGDWLLRRFKQSD